MKIIKRILTWFLRIFSGIIMLFLIIQMFLYFSAPIYTFHKSEHFSGDQWYNPYEGSNPEYWRKCNFQFHTRAWGGLTNGKGDEEVFWKTFKDLGYDVPAISNYQAITRFNEDSAFYIPVYEHGFGIRKNHQLAIGTTRVVWLDYPLYQNIHHKQHIINRIRGTCEVLALSHPSWNNAYTPEDIRSLSNYDIIEAINNNRKSLALWDSALSAGRPVFCMGDDDGHDIYNPYKVGRKCTYVCSPGLKAAELLENLKKGRAYAADISMKENETFKEKAEIAREVPVVEAVEIRGDTLWVRVSKEAMKFDFIGQGGKVVRRVEETDQTWYKLQPEDTYIRTEITFTDNSGSAGTVFYLNPVLRCDGRQPLNGLTASVNHERTWIFRTMTFGSLLAILYIFLRSRKKNGRIKSVV